MNDEMLEELQKLHPDVESSRLQAVLADVRRISPPNNKEYLLKLFEKVLPNYLAEPLIPLHQKDNDDGKS